MGVMGYVLLTASGTLGLVVATVALAARYIPGVNRPVVVTAALAPYLMLGAPLAMMIFVALRSWPLVTGAAALTVATAAVQLPWHVATKAAGNSTIRIVSANLRYGRSDPVAVVRLAVQHADILAVQELTPELADGLSAAGIGDTFPYRVLRARDGPAGVGIWSRNPMRRGRDYEEFWLGLITAHVRIPGSDGEATIVAAHMSAPWPDPIRGWRADLTKLGEALQEIGGATDGPVILAGDLNATPDHLEFRRLLRDGYRDAAEQAGAGLTRTHPADIVIPPVFAVDHILTRGCTATSVRTLSVTDSDHRALVATVVVPN
jgi:endonuclease/exonuclease/phosphatase (EEP) superfamily protein YafD